MKRVLLALLCAVLAVGTAQAQISSAKGSAAISNAVVIEAKAATQNDDWPDVLTTMIQVAQQKELVFDVALQCGLYTDTLVRSKGGTKDTSTADVGIDVRVKLQKVNNDGTLGEEFFAYPDSVTYAKRAQTLMAKFQGIFQECEVYDDAGQCVSYGSDTCLEATQVDNDGDGIFEYPVTLDMDCLDYEEVQLVLDTINANAFNFVSPDLEQGEYIVTVEAKISSSTDFTNGGAAAKGLVGLGSMVVDEVRFIKGDNGTGM